MSYPFDGYPYRRYPTYGYPYPMYPAHHLPFSSSIIDSQLSSIQQNMFNTGVMAGVSQVANSYNVGPIGRSWF